jgi:hypothetical protein
VSGTYNESGLTSLSFHSPTKKMKYGPYGWPSGTEFSLPLSDRVAAVAAFFGNSGNSHSVKSLGVYTYKHDWADLFVNGVRVDTLAHKKMHKHIRVGPWGSRGGTTCDVADVVASSSPEQLQSFTVRSSERSGGRIYGFSFTYLDEDGTTICTGPWGSTSRGRKRVFYIKKKK